MDFYTANSIITFLTVSIFATIFLVFFKRGFRETFFYLWTVGWGLTLLHYLAQVVGVLSPVQMNFPFLLDRLLLSASVLTFYLSAREFVGLSKIRPVVWILGALFVVFSYVQIYHSPEMPKVLFAPHSSETLRNFWQLLNTSWLRFCLGGVLCATGILFFRQRRDPRSAGIRLLSYVFLFWGIAFLTLPFTLRYEYLVPLIVQLINVPKPVVAVAMIIYLFEREEMEVRERQDEAIQQRDFIQNLMDSAHDSIYVTDSDGRFRWANKACERTLGLPVEELKKRSYKDFLDAEQLSLVDQAKKSIDKGTKQSLEIQVHTPLGETRSIQAVISPIRNAQNELDGILAVGRDMTEINALEVQVRHAEKLVALGRMISGVAHELNNPLTTMMGFSELSLQDRNLDSKFRKRFEMILQAANRSKQIVAALQNFVRVPEHKVESVEINDLVGENIRPLEKDLHSHGIETRLRFNPAPIWVDVDRARVGQVIQSILKNAMEAIGEIKTEGRITVSTDIKGEESVVTVTDDGPGIKELEKVFDPFYTTKEVGRGTGLSLSVSYSILKHYGGKIQCENNPQGGATFRMILPLSPLQTALHSTLSTISSDKS